MPEQPHPAHAAGPPERGEQAGAEDAPRIAAMATGLGTAQRELLTTLGGSEQVPNLFSTVSRNPELFTAWLPLCLHQLQSPEFSARHREIVILRTAWLCGSRYEWGHHVSFGRRAGLTDEEIVRLAGGDRGDQWPDSDRALLDAVDELHTGHTISAETWAVLATFLDVSALIALPMLVGHYTLLANLLNSVAVAVDDSVPPANLLIGWASDDKKEHSVCVSE